MFKELLLSTTLFFGVPNGDAAPTLNDVEQYWSSVSGLSCGFEQLNSDGSLHTGRLDLNKMSRTLDMEYSSGDLKSAVLTDSQLTLTNSDGTIQKFEITGDVSALWSRAALTASYFYADQFYITQEVNSVLTLVWERNPRITLHQIQITDQSGNKTITTLSNSQEER